MRHVRSLNLTKPDFLTTDPTETGSIIVSGSNLRTIERFKYLRYEISPCISATCMKLCSTTGVPCNLRRNERFKSKIHRSVIHLVVLYDCEY